MPRTLRHLLVATVFAGGLSLALPVAAHDAPATGAQVASPDVKDAWVTLWSFLQRNSDRAKEVDQALSTLLRYADGTVKGPIETAVAGVVHEAVEDEVEETLKAHPELIVKALEAKPDLLDQRIEATLSAKPDLVAKALIANPAMLEKALATDPGMMERVLTNMQEQRQKSEMARQQAAASGRLAALLDPVGIPVIGNKNGDVTIIEFLDHNCTYCRKAEPDVTKVVEADGKVKRITKILPILGPGSQAAAKVAVASIAAGDGLYERLHKRFMDSAAPRLDDASVRTIAQEVGMSSAAIDAALSGDLPAAAKQATELSAQIGVRGTPFFVVSGPNGIRTLPGAVPESEIRKAIAEVRGAQ